MVLRFVLAESAGIAVIALSSRALARSRFGGIKAAPSLFVVIMMVEVLLAAAIVANFARAEWTYLPAAFGMMVRPFFDLSEIARVLRARAS